jgi:thioredoxin 1
MKKVMARTITDDNFTEVLQEGKPVVIDFWAEWCGPCRAVSPIMDELAGEYDGQVIVGKVNVDDNVTLTSQFSIRNIPTVLFFDKDQQIVDKHVGATPKSSFVKKIETLLK